MKKILVLTTLALSALTAMADNHLSTQKLQIVKKIYSAVANENTNVHQVLSKFSTRDFNAVFAENERNTPEGEIGCIEYDLVTQGQDYNAQEISRSLKTTLTPKGHVLVTFKNFGETNKLIYVMKCEGNRCLIDDVLQNGTSFKNSIRQCIKNS